MICYTIYHWFLDIRFKNKSPIRIELEFYRTLQLCLNKVEKWADENSFKFSKSKTVYIHFCNKRKLHPDPTLTIYNSQIPVVTQTKFLGVNMGVLFLVLLVSYILRNWNPFKTKA